MYTTQEALQICPEDANQILGANACSLLKTTSHLPILFTQWSISVWWFWLLVIATSVQKGKSDCIWARKHSLQLAQKISDSPWSGAFYWLLRQQAKPCAIKPSDSVVLFGCANQGSLLNVFHTYNLSQHQLEMKLLPHMYKNCHMTSQLERIPHKPVGNIKAVSSKIGWTGICLTLRRCYFFNIFFTRQRWFDRELY